MRSRELNASILLISALSFGLVACGDSTTDGSTGTSTTVASADSASPDASTASTVPADSVPAVSAPPKPAVEIPTELPAELVITDLADGDGAAAAVGDVVVVHYVGVRSEDGVEFDNSYDRGSPFPVTLGAGGVIQGWDDGLVGVKAGGRRQLDIPSDLAYGDQPQGDVIKAGDPLSFVIDVVGVFSRPDITIEPAENREKIDIEDLVVGEGPEIVAGQTAVLHIVAYRADTGEMINSTWDSGRPFEFTFASGETIAGLEFGVDEMHIGGRRKVLLPYVLAFGEEGSPDAGLPPKTDMVLVMDLIAVS